MWLVSLQWAVIRRWPGAGSRVGCWFPGAKWADPQPFSPTWVVDSGFWLTRRRRKKGWLQLCPENGERETEVGVLSKPLLLYKLKMKGCCGVGVARYSAACHCLNTAGSPAEVCNDPQNWFCVGATSPEEGGLMVSSQAAVESCHRNWLAVWQGRASSSVH